MTRLLWWAVALGLVAATPAQAAGVKKATFRVSIKGDCGTKSFRGLGLTLGYQLGGKAKDQLDLRPEMIDDPFRNCPSGGEAFPVLVHSSEGAPMQAALPRDEVFDRRLGKIIVIARGKESVTDGEHTYITKTRWEVTFRRLG